MIFLYRSIKVLRYQLYKLLKTYRIPLFILLLLIHLYAVEEPIRAFSEDVGIAAAPWIFPIFSSNYLAQMIFMIGAIVIFCDAPFTKEEDSYMLYRSGKTAWAFGHSSYIILVSFLYTIVLVLLTVAPLIGHLQLERNWGKILGTLAYTDASQIYKLTYEVSPYLLRTFDPLQATFYSFLLVWGGVTFLGLFMYLFNTVSKSFAGTFSSFIFIFLDLMIYNAALPNLYFISPVSMTQLYLFVGANKAKGLTLKYAFCFFIISILLLLLAIHSLTFKKFFRKYIYIAKRRWG